MSSTARVLLGAALWLGLASPAAATIWEVDAEAECPGSGTAAAPYCAISSAAAVAAPGDLVNVAPGSYREQVTPTASGAPGLPIRYHGAPGAKVYGTDDLSGIKRWMHWSGTTFSTSYDPPTNPRQVWVDGNALTEATAGPENLPVNAFYYDDAEETLYVNFGFADEDPGLHEIEAGARSFGFSVDSKSWLVIEGFEVRGQNTNGIRVRSSANVVVSGNRVLHARSFGLVADGTTAPTTTGPIEISNNELLENGDAGLRLRTNVTQATVRDNLSHHNRNHGFSISGTTASTFAGNTFYANARPGGVSTTGFLMEDSDGNRIERNLAYGNQDTGFQLSGGADGNLLVRNISYQNGDHGFDIREGDATRLVSNTSYGNTNDGYSIEGDVTNAYLRNNIAAENGVTTGGNELWVDSSSTTGFSSNYDVFWRSTNTNTIEYNGDVYNTLALFRSATGHEQQGSGSNPQLENPAGLDFHPTSGPAIDSADASASGFALLDFDEQAPVDRTSVANTGAGVPNFADRGALENTDAPPVARIQVSPTNIQVNRTVTANASTSTDDDGIVQYRFEWGDGTGSTTQTGPVATHVYRSRGTRTLRLTVTDTVGQTHSVTRTLQIR
jgi:parallel beta-helix repeat protein